MVHIVDASYMREVADHANAISIAAACSKIFEQIEWLAHSGIYAYTYSCTNDWFAEKISKKFESLGYNTFRWEHGDTYYVDISW
jgi:hypothetical protein